ncbi:response regulator transcription factor [uncultured Pseudokineococcus sp.]|uniref:response regulator n=1 Tax=uncultured Pseudokineococcus sp. TaxID=1642928 RepID=UPI00263803F0|nr:response regulator transcription factor [uncultured Pseudokineococcus sp.]
MSPAAPSQQPPLRLVLVDDEPLIRAGLRMLLSTAPDLLVVGEAGDGLEALEVCRQERPDVVLVDVRMPRLDGVATTRRLVHLDPAPAVLVLTTYGLDAYVRESLRAGASGYLLKDAPADRIAAAVRAAHEGVTTVDRSLTEQLLRSGGPPTPSVPTAPGAPPLTERELEVLRLVAVGRSNDEIAAELCIGPATVKTHVSHVIAKLGVRTRTQAAALALRGGLAP